MLQRRESGAERDGLCNSLEVGEELLRAAHVGNALVADAAQVIRCS